MEIYTEEYDEIDFLNLINYTGNTCLIDTSKSEVLVTQSYENSKKRSSRLEDRYMYKVIKVYESFMNPHVF